MLLCVAMMSMGCLGRLEDDAENDDGEVDVGVSFFSVSAVLLLVAMVGVRDRRSSSRSVR